MKIFFLPVLIILSTAVFSQQKPSDRSFASEINKVKEKQQAVYKTIQQNQQIVVWNDTLQNNNSKIQPAGTVNKINSSGSNLIQVIPISKESNPQPIKSKPSSRPMQFPEKLRKTGSGGL